MHLYIKMYKVNIMNFYVRLKIKARFSYCRECMKWRTNMGWVRMRVQKIYLYKGLQSFIPRKSSNVYKAHAEILFTYLKLSYLRRNYDILLKFLEDVCFFLCYVMIVQKNLYIYCKFSHLMYSKQNFELWKFSIV